MIFTLNLIQVSVSWLIDFDNIKLIQIDVIQTQCSMC